jgi:hypothetical protein
MFLGRKYHEMLGRNRILPIVEALDRVAASDATT